MLSWAWNNNAINGMEPLNISALIQAYELRGVEIVVLREQVVSLQAEVNLPLN